MGLKTFRLTPEFAQASKALAANQGLYNGFISAGLFWAFFHHNPDVASQLKCFFLSCVIVAGIYGAFTVSKKIFFIQALPAVFALILVLIQP